MSIVWGWPIGFAAFAALLLPIWLHLDRRRSMRVLPFAAMRFIGSAHPPRRTWRLLEWLLLVLRMLLLAAVVAWLALPRLLGEWRAPQHVLAVVPGLSAAQIRVHTDGIDRALWMNNALATMDLANLDDSAAGPASDSDQPPLASLLRQLDAELAEGDQLRVLLSEQVGGLDAQAIGLSRAVEWRIASADAAAEGEPSSKASTPLQRSLAIRYEAADAPALRWLRAANAAWASDSSMQVTVDEQPAAVALPSEVDALIWVGDQPSAAAQNLLAAGSRLLHLHSAESAATPAGLEDAAWPGPSQRVGLGMQTRVSASFEPRELPILHSSEFPAALFAVVFAEPPAPTRAYASQIVPTLVSSRAEARKTPLRPWLGGLIASLFLLERVLASGRRLRGAA